MGAWLAIGVQLLGLPLGLIVEGNTECPSPAGVAAAAKPLLPDDIGPDFHFRLVRQLGWGAAASPEASSAWLRLQMFDADGELLAEKRLPADADCARIAKRAAAIAAAWEAQLSDEALPVVTPPPPAPQRPVVTARTPETAPPTAEATAKPPPALPRKYYPGFMVLGAGGSYTPYGGLAGVVNFGWGARWGRLGAQGNAWAELSRASGFVGPGPTDTVTYSRLAVDVGPTLRLTGDPELELGVSVAVAAILTSSVSVDPGADLAGRLIFGKGNARPFIEARAVVWPRYFGATSGPQLSPVDLLISCGLALGGS